MHSATHTILLDSRFDNVVEAFRVISDVTWIGLECIWLLFDQSCSLYLVAPQNWHKISFSSIVAVACKKTNETHNIITLSVEKIRNTIRKISDHDHRQSYAQLLKPRVAASCLLIFHNPSPKSAAICLSVNPVFTHWGWVIYQESTLNRINIPIFNSQLCFLSFLRKLLTQFFDNIYLDNL